MLCECDVKMWGRGGGKCEYLHLYNRPTTPERHLLEEGKKETKTCHLTKRWKKVSPLRNFNVGNKKPKEKEIFHLS